MIHNAVLKSEIDYFAPTHDDISNVWSVNEWGKLHEIILGDPTNAYLPSMDDISQLNFDRLDDDEVKLAIASKMPEQVIDETHEDLEQLRRVLVDQDVRVINALTLDLSMPVESPYWRAEQESAINVRDLTLIHGDLAIDVPSPTRGRYFEGIAVRKLLLDYYKQRNYSGLLCPPRPQLFDNTYDLSRDCGINETEPLFDAANCMRLGRDIIIDINNTANIAGAQWLQSTLDCYHGQGVVKVHTVSLSPDHIDVVFIPLCEGHALINPAYVTDSNLPDFLYKWNLIEAPEMVGQPYYSPTPKASNNIGMNLLVIDGEERTVLVEEQQLPLINRLAQHGFRPIPVRWRHGRTWGGAFHCISLDTHRSGEL